MKTFSIIMTSIFFGLAASASIPYDVISRNIRLKSGQIKDGSGCELKIEKDPDFNLPKNPTEFWVTFGSVYSRYTAFPFGPSYNNGPEWETDFAQGVVKFNYDDGSMKNSISFFFDTHSMEIKAFKSLDSDTCILN